MTCRAFKDGGQRKMHANLGQKCPLFGYVQSFILHARLLDQTNRMHGPTESNLCSSDYSAICSKDFFLRHEQFPRNFDGRVITSNWFSNCLFMRPERSQNRTEPTKKSMCDMCGYYGHVWHISHAPLKITNFRTVVNYCDIFWAFQKAPEKAVHLEQSPSWQSWSWKIQDMNWMSPSGN